MRKRALFGQLSRSDTQDAYNLRVTKIDDALFGTGDLRDFFDWFYEKEQPISKANSVRSVPTSEEHGGESEPGKKIFFLSSIQSFINLFSLSFLYSEPLDEESEDEVKIVAEKEPTPKPTPPKQPENQVTQSELEKETRDNYYARCITEASRLIRTGHTNPAMVNSFSEIYFKTKGLSKKISKLFSLKRVSTKHPSFRIFKKLPWQQ